MAYFVEFTETDKLGVLHEMTRTEVIKARLAKPLHFFDAIDTAGAHNWVKEGYRHTTPLWVDDQGKVRRAQANS